MEEELFSLFDNLSIISPVRVVAVAVSGGRDSVFLSLMLKKWANKNNLFLIALIVDHKLRRDSTNEAEQTQKLLTDFGISVKILTRKNIPIFTKIQQQARIDRYFLLENYCYNHQIPYLFVAHTKNDQLETYYMRASRGKSLVGNAGISTINVNEKVTIIRPLLHILRKDITAYLINNNIKWIDDPSNKNKKYERVRIRDHIKNNHFGIDLYKKQLAEQFNRKKIEQQFVEFICNDSNTIDGSSCRIHFKLLLNLDISTQIYIMNQIIKYIGGSIYGVKLKKIIYLLESLEENKKRTLGNCIFILDKQILFIYLENNQKRIKKSLFSNYFI